MNGETPDRQILELRDVCYIVGKVFSRRVQRRWNHVNRLSGSGEKVELCGEWLMQGGEDRKEGSVHLDLSSSTPRDILRVGCMVLNRLGMRGLSLTLVIIHQ